jgi:hypothetical protein
LVGAGRGEENSGESESSRHIWFLVGLLPAREPSGDRSHENLQRPG